jgi:hypothetical protein
MIRPAAIATAIAGTLDLSAASLLTLWYGRKVPDMLRYVASGPIPAAPKLGTVGAILGFIVHYALMAIMVTIYMVWARNRQHRPNPWLSGLVYGFITYVVMNLIIVPLRFGTPLPPSTAAIVSQLFCHIVLVGIPIAWITDRAIKNPSPTA